MSASHLLKKASILNVDTVLTNTDLSNLSNTGEAHFTNPDLSNLSIEGQAVLDAKANVSLNNLDATGQAVINGKANVDLDNLSATGNAKFQTPITGGASTITSSNLTASRALISNANGKVGVSSITSTKLGYLTDVTSNIQAQLNGKANVDLSNLSATGEAHFANPSLSNVNSTGKAAAVGWGMPNYAAGVARSVDTTYTPSKNVLVIFYSFCSTGMMAHIYVNGVAIEQAGNGFASGWDTLIAYIPKGTPYKCGTAGYGNQHSIIEYPLIGG